MQPARLQRADGLFEALGDLLQANRIDDFSLFAVGDVEDIDDLIQVCADLGNAHGESQFEERAGDGVQQAHLIEREHIDDRETIGRLGVQADDGRIPFQFIRRGTFLAAPNLAKRGPLPRDVFERSDERPGDLGTAVRRRFVREMRILDNEAIEHQTIG